MLSRVGISHLLLFSVLKCFLKNVFAGYIGLIFSALNISKGLCFLLLTWLSVYDFIVIHIIYCHTCHVWLHCRLTSRTPFQKTSHILRRPHNVMASMAGHRFIFLPLSGTPLKSYLVELQLHLTSAFFTQSYSSASFPGISFLFASVRVFPSKLPVCTSVLENLRAPNLRLWFPRVD